MQKGRLFLVILCSVFFLMLFIHPVFAAPLSTIRVGLSYGKDAWSQARFSSQEGVRIGFDHNQAPLITLPPNDQLTVVGDGFRLEVGQYSSKAEAERTTAALKGAKISAVTYHLASGKWAVRTGQAPSPEGLADLRAQLRQNGYAQWQEIGAFRLQLAENYPTKADADQRVAQVRGLGLPAYPGYDGSWRVWVGDQQVGELAQLQTAVAALLPGVQSTVLSPDINRVVLLDSQYDPILVYSAQNPPTFISSTTLQRADNYRIEVGKYDNLMAANQVRQQLANLGYSAYVYRHEEWSQLPYTVLVGDGWDVDSARTVRSQLESKGFKDKILRMTGPYHLISFRPGATLEAVSAKVSELRSKQIEASVYYDNGWRVAVGNAATAAELDELRARLSVISPLELYNPTEIDGGRMQVFDDGGRIVGFYQVPPERTASLKVWTDDGGSILLKEKNGSYPGSFEIRRYYHGRITVINQVSMDDYVAGVVAQEMYPSWPVEALKAQAVAARSYAATRVGSPSLSQWGCDVDATTGTQAYTNLDKARLPNVQRAVHETTGQYAMYNGSIAETLYHADSGGCTENSENVYASPLPYLRGVPELFPDENPNGLWQETFTSEEVASKLRRAGYADIGTVTDMVIDKVGVSGRPVALRISGTAGQVILTKEQPRSVFGLFSNNFTIGRPGGASAYARGAEGLPTIVALPQTMIMGAAGKQAIALSSGTVVRGSDQMTTLTGGSAAGKFTLYGKGSGHGVGLSQWGAKTMADHGYTYSQILQHYYKDIVIQ